MVLRMSENDGGKGVGKKEKKNKNEKIKKKVRKKGTANEAENRIRSCQKRKGCDRERKKQK